MVLSLLMVVSTCHHNDCTMFQLCEYIGVLFLSDVAAYTFYIINIIANVMASYLSLTYISTDLFPFMRSYVFIIVIVSSLHLSPFPRWCWVWSEAPGRISQSLISQSFTTVNLTSTISYMLYRYF